jgi:hypothetical protein
MSTFCGEEKEKETYAAKGIKLFIISKTHSDLKGPHFGGPWNLLQILLHWFGRLNLFQLVNFR